MEYENPIKFHRYKCTPSNGLLFHCLIDHSNWQLKRIKNNENVTAKIFSNCATKMADEILCNRLNKTRLTIDDIRQVEQFCYQLVKANELSQLKNDAKLRAVNSTKTYDEFKDIVDAAHLQPLNRLDQKDAKTHSRLWNSIAKK